MVDFFSRDSGSATATEDVLFAVDGSLGRILLNRPKAINALNTSMVAAMRDQLNDWADDESVATVAISGAGERGLCAGGDVRFIRDSLIAGDTAPGLEFWRIEYDLNAKIANYPKPYFAIMDGVVLGGGVGISAHGSRRLVTERTKIAMPETIIGLFPDVGARWLLSRAPGEFGTHLALTGSMIDGPTAIAGGLADAMIDSARIDDVLTSLASGQPIDDLLSHPPAPPLPAWLDCYAGVDAAAIIERLAAHSDPEARAAAEAIRARSPFSVAVTLAGIRRAAQLSSVEEVLDQDLIIGGHFLTEPDFIEGVRAQVIDKDRTPRWRHASVSEVDPAEVAAVFEPTA